MDRFKIGDVAYHRAGNKQLGTICGIGDDKVKVRLIEALSEIEMYPAELKTESDIESENRAEIAEINAINARNHQDVLDRYGL